MCYAPIDRHQDHSKYIPNALKYGLEVYSCQEVQSIHPQVKVLKKGLKSKIGGFLVQPIPVQHNAECYAFLIEHNEFGRLLFLTDCNDFTYKLKNINHILCEANWSEDIIIDNAMNDEDIRSMSENHLEINQTIDILKTNYSVDLQNVVLLHLSSANANANEFEKRVKEELNFDNVCVAKKGLEIELLKSEF